MITVVSNTSGFGDAKLRSVMRFVSPRGLPNTMLTVRKARFGVLFTGSAFTQVRPREVVVRIGDACWYPCPPTEGMSGGYLEMPGLRSRTEGIVVVLAHELRHVWQHAYPKARRLCTAGHASHNKMCEQDADLYALRQLRRWRSHTRKERA